MDEDPWWDPTDQAVVQGELVVRRDLGRGWLPAPMWNNAERLDPYGDDPASAAIRAARQARRLTALDEGAAWRRRRDATLVVLRAEAFADPDDTAHRAVWQQEGRACLDAVFRARWRERDREPGWIEARWRADVDGTESPEEADWIRIEDHTGSADTERVTCYEHFTVWHGRGLATVTVRHDLGEDVDDAVLRMAAVLPPRLGALDR